MKVKLLNNGLYGEHLEIVVGKVVEAAPDEEFPEDFTILGANLIKAGADPELINEDFEYYFYKWEGEIVEK